MFTSQASYTFNTPILPSIPTVSTSLLSQDDLTSSAGSPILQSVAEFIYPSYSSFSFIFKSTATTTPAHSNSHQDDRTYYSPFEDAVSRLYGNYRDLSTTMKDIEARHGDKRVKTLSLPLKALILAETTHFKYHIKNLLCRLAVLTFENPQEYLVRIAHRICVALAGSQTFRSSLQGHKSSGIYELLTMISNVSLTVENSIYQDCAKEYIKVEDYEETAKMLSLASVTGKASDRETSSSLIDMLMMKKTISGSDEDAEEESERHERSSTTSASSRANNCEVDVPIIYNVFGSSPESQTTTSATKEKDNSELTNMYEIYDGCFFGDLTISFERNDKLLFEDDEIVGPHGHHTWRKNYNNNYNRNNMNYNFPKPPVFNSNQSSYPGFNQRLEEPNWRTNPIQTINPSLLKTPPTQDQKIIPLNLFTLPQGTFMPNNMPTNTFPPFNPANLAVPVPGQQISTPPYNNKRAPVNQGIHTLKALSEQKPRDVSRESQTSLLSDRQHNQQNQHVKSGKGMPAINKVSNQASAPKNSQTQADKNASAGKKGKSQNTKKKQEKGGFKLWDMISVQGKLKNL